MHPSRPSRGPGERVIRASASAVEPWLIIVNPTAGGGRAGRDDLRAFARRLARALPADIALTEGPGHATALAASAADYTGLAVVGGDGTVSEVVNGMDRARQALLVVSAGTGNGLARDLGLATPRAVLDAARSDRHRALDLARVTFRDRTGWHGRLMVSTAGVGFVAEATARAHGGYKRVGPTGYSLAAARQVLHQRPFEAVVRLGASPARKLSLTNVMINNTCHAGNFAAFPDTDPTDGRLRVLLARAGAAAQLAHAASVLSRTYAFTTGPEHEARSVTMTLANPQRLMVDGELWEYVSAVRFDVLPGALARVVVGRGWDASR